MSRRVGFFTFSFVGVGVYEGGIGGLVVCGRLKEG